MTMDNSCVTCVLKMCFEDERQKGTFVHAEFRDLIHENILRHSGVIQHLGGKAFLSDGSSFTSCTVMTRRA